MTSSSAPSSTSWPRRAESRFDYLIGRRQPGARRSSTLDPRAIDRLVPDVRMRDVFICGPDEMNEGVRHSLRALDVANSQIHVERFAN